MTIIDGEIILTREEFDEIPTLQTDTPSVVTDGFLYKRLTGTGWWIIECLANPEGSQNFVHNPRKIRTIQ
jgi:hypothetical protein